jgi:hypothetical protein
MCHVLRKQMRQQRLHLIQQQLQLVWWEPLPPLCSDHQAIQWLRLSSWC